MTSVLITTASFDQAGAGTTDLLRQEGLTVHENPFGRSLTEAEVSALITEHRPVALIAGTEPLTAAVLQAAVPHLKVIARCGVGLENVDVATAVQLGIAVSNTPEAPSQAVAELTIGLMLDLLRQISVSDRRLRAGQWTKPLGVLVGELTVGLVGLGRIGKRVAGLCQAFGATIIASDPNPDLEWSRRHQVPVVPLDELLGRADLVSLHVSWASGRTALIDAAALSRMKRGSFLINTSRGGAADQSALAQALASGHLAGAAIDTFEHEPYEGPLLQIDRVICTPHLGSYARGARIRMEREAVENLLRGLA